MITPKKLVVVAPHPDDETLGCGGTIARFAGLGTEVSVLIVSGHLPPLYDRDVACRPSHRAAPTVVLAYETLSETHWNVPGIEPAFVPELFVDVTKHMPKKKAALECYASQINHAPSRSIDACVALARFRGSQNGCDYAEAFKVVRIVV